jgi:hypothetical protein
MTRGYLAGRYSSPGGLDTASSFCPPWSGEAAFLGQKARPFRDIPPYPR